MFVCMEKLIRCKHSNLRVLQLILARYAMVGCKCMQTTQSCVRQVKSPMMQTMVFALVAIGHTMIALLHSSYQSTTHKV